MTRHVTAGAAILALAAFIAWDWQASATPNVFKAPPFIALGAGGQAPTAHCAALPID